MPKLTDEAKEGEEVETKRITIKEDDVMKSTPPTFPQALKGKKKTINQAEIL